MSEIKTYIINDNWTDLGAENKVAVLSVDGEIDKVYINGEEAGGGGGGGDFVEIEMSFDAETYAATLNKSYDDLAAYVSQDKIPVIVVSEEVATEMFIIPGRYSLSKYWVSDGYNADFAGLCLEYVSTLNSRIDGFTAQNSTDNLSAAL